MKASVLVQYLLPHRLLSHLARSVAREPRLSVARSVGLPGGSGVHPTVAVGRSACSVVERHLCLHGSLRQGVEVAFESLELVREWMWRGLAQGDSHGAATNAATIQSVMPISTCTVATMRM